MLFARNALVVDQCLIWELTDMMGVDGNAVVMPDGRQVSSGRRDSRRPTLLYSRDEK